MPRMTETERLMLLARQKGQKQTNEALAKCDEYKNYPIGPHAMRKLRFEAGQRWEEKHKRK